jgi:hypothetical protein
VIDVAADLTRYFFSFREIASLKIRRATGPDSETTPAVKSIMPGGLVVIPLDTAVTFVFCPLA